MGTASLNQFGQRRPELAHRRRRRLRLPVGRLAGHRLERKHTGSVGKYGRVGIKVTQGDNQGFHALREAHDGYLPPGGTSVESARDLR